MFQNKNPASFLQLFFCHQINKRPHWWLCFISQACTLTGYRHLKIFPGSSQWFFEIVRFSVFYSWGNETKWLFCTAFCPCRRGFLHGQINSLPKNSQPEWQSFVLCGSYYNRSSCQSSGSFAEQCIFFVDILENSTWLSCPQEQRQLTSAFLSSCLISDLYLFCGYIRAILQTYALKAVEKVPVITWLP